MRRADFAEQLISEPHDSDRKRLLDAHRNLADLRLAYKIKDLCYAAWTSEPIKAQRASTALRSLAKQRPDIEIVAVAAWVSGISNITKAKFETAVKELDRAAGIFVGISKDHEAAQTQVAKLIALALLGRYDEANETGKQALRTFEKYGDELAAGKIEMNLSNIAARRELHREAEAFCSSALRRFKKLREKTWQTMAENGLANTYAEINDFRRAEKYYTIAAESARRAKMFVTEAEIEASMGNLALFRGRYAEALKLLELSRQKYEKLKMPHQTAIAELEIADIYAELNLVAEAFEIYERLVGTLRSLKMRNEEARARIRFAQTAARIGNASLAGRELNKAAKLYHSEKNGIGIARVQIEMASLELSLKNFREALAAAETALKILGKTENRRFLHIAKWQKAESLRLGGKRAAAKRLLDDLVVEAIRNEQKNIVIASLNSLGKIAMDRSDFPKAKTYFRKALGIVENLRSPLAGEEFRMAFLANKLEPYENLTAIALTENRIADAFLYTERARSRSLLEALNSGSAKTGATPELGKRAETIREELNWFYSRLDRTNETETAGLESEIRSREKELVSLTRQIESTAADEGVGSRRASIFDHRNLQKQLGDKKALVEFVRSGGTFSAFVVTGGKLFYARDLASETEIIELLEGLRFQFGTFRLGVNSLGKFGTELKRRADLYLHRLHEKLLAPVMDEVGVSDLVIVPTGTLHYVPFHALHDGSRYVIEDRMVSYAPSAAVWQALQGKKRRKAQNTLLMGFADESIPLVDREIKDLGRVMRGSVSFTGKDCTFSAFSGNAPKFDILHLACHGQFRAENPLFSSLHLADGWITVRDICSKRLRAELVTLSACETGLNKIFAGEEILGLARGFLSAGAASLVLSLWTVNDEATLRLMKDFYSNLQRGESVAASLRIAQKNFIDRGEHPYFWSPFVAIGR